MGQANQTKYRSWLVATAILVGLVLVAAAVGSWVAGRDDGRGSAGRIRQWVAVLSVGPDARSLYRAAAEVGKVAGVYVFVDRWACYEGFPPGSQPSSDEWFLGVAAPDRTTVDGIVAELGRAPIIEAEVDQGCALPPDRPDLSAVATAAGRA